ncbi:flagellar hook-basal body protein [Gorillibacterium massiliense]|uniref:flagellar hook-basal body protein n=1 Tax=Gorillibacterium massiliense TaxID=1280390 RepID=UPI0004ACF25C|nr:flagellar hook-basal body protein [Gorillibacterium massiliense]
MLRGLYTAAAGMITQQRRHDAATNNIANLNTPGYKQVNAVTRSFPEMLISLTGGGQTNPANRHIGRLNTGVMAEEDPSTYVQGDLMETDNSYDFAISSDIQDANGLNFNGSGMAFDADGNRIFQKQAFFTVQDANGQTRYTRSGDFTVTADGHLTTPEGYKVLGSDGQPIVMTDPTTGAAIPDATLAADGTFLDAVTGKPLTGANGGRMALLLSRVDDPNRLILEGNGVYRINAGDEGTVTALTDGAGGVPNPELTALTTTGQLTVHQGYLERSNVDSAQATIDMNSALRAYEVNQKIVQYYDKSLDKAVNEVGRV